MNSLGVVDMKHGKLKMFVFFFSSPFSKDIFQDLLQLPRVPFLRFFQFGQSENSPQKLSLAETWVVEREPEEGKKLVLSSFKTLEYHELNRGQREGVGGDWFHNWFLVRVCTLSSGCTRKVAKYESSISRVPL